MGLDMYLSKKTYVKQWSHQPAEERFEVSIKKGGVTYPHIRSERVSYVTEEVAYWRKANQIHGWLCNNTEEVAADVKYNVSTDNLKELLEVCKKVLNILDNAKKVVVQVEGGWRNGESYMVDHEVYEDVEEITELLPPTQGFFFGSGDIDEWYKEQIVHTINVLEEELAIPDDYNEYEYYASW